MCATFLCHQIKAYSFAQNNLLLYMYLISALFMSAINVFLLLFITQAQT